MDRQPIDAARRPPPDHGPSVTDPARVGDRRLYLCCPGRDDIEPFLEACIRGGVDVVQLREKHLEDAALVAMARRAAKVCRELGGLKRSRQHRLSRGSVGEDRGIRSGSSSRGLRVACC